MSKINKKILPQIIILLILIIGLFFFIQTYKINVQTYNTLLILGKDIGFYKIITPIINNIVGNEYLKQIEIKEKENISNEPTKFSIVESASIPILMYHHIHPDFINSSDKILAGLTVSPQKFEQDIISIKEKGYTTIFPQEIFDVFSGKLDPNKKYIVITIDDGYLDNYTFAFELLKKYQMKAIIYIIPNRMGKKVDNNDYFSWDQAKEMMNSGYITFGSHTMDHKDLTTQNNEELRYQIFESKKIIENELDTTILDFCYPYGRFNTNVSNFVKEAGYNNATTTAYGMERRIENRFTWSRLRTFQNTSLNNSL